MRWCGLPVLLLLIFSPCAGAAQEQPENQAKVSKDGFASCFDAQTGGLKGSEVVRTPVLISADGKWRAYAQSEALASGPEANGPDCENTSKLYIAGPESKGFQCVHTVKPQEQQLLNAIVPVDWSPDGRFLLMNEFLGQWGSDFGEFLVRTYDVLTGAVSDERLVERAVTKHAGKKCEFENSAKGFSPSGAIVIEIEPVRDEEGPLVPDTCVKVESLLLLDPDRVVVSALPAGYKVQQYGKFAER